MHSLTEEKSQKEKEDFYEEIEIIMPGMNNSKIRTMMSDMNAKRGKEQGFKPIICKHSLHETTNNDGMKLIDLATGKRF